MLAPGVADNNSTETSSSKKPPWIEKVGFSTVPSSPEASLDSSGVGVVKNKIWFSPSS